MSIGLGFTIWDLGFRLIGFEVLGFGIWVSGNGLRVMGFGIWVLGYG
jgi:hypothetical protein